MKKAMRSAHMVCISFVAMLVATCGAAASTTWTLDSQTGDKGKSCSLSRTDQGRTISVTLALLPDTTDQGVVGVEFDQPKLIQGARRSAIATLQFSNGNAETHRIEETAGGLLLIPMVSLRLQDLLQKFQDSSRLTVATDFGSTAFNLDGIADHIPALRDCAGS
jgi:hypothetical protein